MSTVEDKLKAVEDKFRKGFKSYDAARYIVRANRDILEDEKKAICQEIPIAKKTLEGVFTKLRKLELYPPQKTEDIPKHPLTPEGPKETGEVTEVPLPPQQEYATKEDFLTLKNSINYLASLMSKDVPSNPGELASVMRGEALSNPGESEEKEYLEVIQPEEVFIQDASLTKASVWITPKTQIYYDMAKQGAFFYYAGTQVEGPFIRFKGNLSDFFNRIVDDYFIRCYNADIGLKTWRGL